MNPWDHQQGSALQGFASGDCERDAQAINIFMEDGHAMGCSQSYAKNMGLYGQRIGCFSIVTEDPKEAVKVESQMKVHLFLYSALEFAYGCFSCVGICVTRFG